MLGVLSVLPQIQPLNRFYEGHLLVILILVSQKWGFVPPQAPSHYFKGSSQLIYISQASPAAFLQMHVKTTKRHAGIIPPWLLSVMTISAAIWGTVLLMVAIRFFLYACLTLTFVVPTHSWITAGFYPLTGGHATIGKLQKPFHAWGHKQTVICCNEQ